MVFLGLKKRHMRKFLVIPTNNQIKFTTNIVVLRPEYFSVYAPMYPQTTVWVYQVCKYQIIIFVQKVWVIITVVCDTYSRYTQVHPSKKLAENCSSYEDTREDQTYVH